MRRFISTNLRLATVYTTLGDIYCSRSDTKNYADKLSVT